MQQGALMLTGRTPKTSFEYILDCYVTTSRRATPHAAAPPKPETAPCTLRCAPSTRQRKHEGAPICRRSCLLPTHRRLQTRRSALSTRKRPREVVLSAAAPAFSAYANRPTSQKRQSALSTWRRPREAVNIYSCPCLAPNQRRPPNAAKSPVYLAAPTRTDALCRCTCLMPTLRRLPKAAKHPV